MKNNKLTKLLPDVATLKDKKGLGVVGVLAQKKPLLFVMKRTSVALGFSIGLAWGMIPLPIQVVGSLVCCYFLNANIPAAVLAAFMTNPLTAPLILTAAYYLGSFFVETPFVWEHTPAWSLLWSDPLLWLEKMTQVLSHMGETLLIGIPLCSLIAGISSYYAIRWGWWWAVVCKRRQRVKNYMKKPSHMPKS